MTSTATLSLAELAAQLHADPAACAALVAPLEAGEAAALVDHLKSEADRHWWINANQSLEFADLIVRVGQARGDAWQVALGTMARGDALKFVGNIAEAWELLGQAGTLFTSIGDEVGWARTRIGRLLICTDLNHVPEALQDAEQARSIFIQHKVDDKRLILDLNTAIVYNLLGDQQRALVIYQNALVTAESLGSRGQRWLGAIYTNLGNAFNSLGRFRQASTYYELAFERFVEEQEYRAAGITKLNLAHIATMQSNYRRALTLLQQAYDTLFAERLFFDANNVQRDMVECYLALNRFAEARDLARELTTLYQANNSAHREALTLLHLASAEASLQNIEAALDALHSAEQIFSTLSAHSWLAVTQLRRGKIALAQGDMNTADTLARAAADFFANHQQQISYATAMLVRAEIQLVNGAHSSARQIGLKSLAAARSANVAVLRYAAHILLGKVAEREGKLTHAIRHYQAAIATIARVERGLSITLRPDFLEDKGEAFHALMRIQLGFSSLRYAFETLERAKSLTWLSYLSDGNQLRWPTNKAGTQHLLDELKHLREEHQWYYHLAFDELPQSEAASRTIDSAATQHEVAIREHRIRAITEQLYLEADEATQAHVIPPRLHEVQATLDPTVLLLEYYNDGDSIVVFCVSTNSIVLYQLPITVPELQQRVRQLQLNITSALKVGATHSAGPQLAALAHRMLQQLYAQLLGSCEPMLTGMQRLIIVPYGALHFLPFQLLRNQQGYLIEQYEVVTLPAAGLITRQPTPQPAGVLALGYSWQAKLPGTLHEAQIAQDLLGGYSLCEGAATRDVLASPPVQVLHIAAHGEHRLDQPDLSFLQLADGQLYANDLFQHDLSYELVVLSGCETGQANVAGRDELIGLGRGFLYAGAASLITSLWRVTDDVTVDMMQLLYDALRQGASKAAALRDAQVTLLQKAPNLHPAFWGAFQLIGHAGPLVKRPGSSHR